jgi:hypothetical protein
MKKTVYLLILMIAVQTIHAANELSTITTTLIVIEEKENNTIASESTPFSDAVFNALWEKEYIFFDMKIDKPMLYAGKILSVQPYLNTARASGADSILLIKLNYSTLKEDRQTIINIPDAEYHLYSLNAMKTLRNGKIEMKIHEVFQSPDEKAKILKNCGDRILAEIYQ